MPAACPSTRGHARRFTVSHGATGSTPGLCIRRSSCRGHFSGKTTARDLGARQPNGLNGPGLRRRSFTRKTAGLPGRLPDPVAQQARHARNQEIGFRGERAGGQCIVLWLRDTRVAAGMNTSVWDMNDHVQALARSRQAAEVTALPIPAAPLGALARRAHG